MEKVPEIPISYPKMEPPMAATKHATITEDVTFPWYCSALSFATPAGPRDPPAIFKILFFLLSVLSKTRHKTLKNKSLFPRSNWHEIENYLFFFFFWGSIIQDQLFKSRSSIYIDRYRDCMTFDISYAYIYLCKCLY